MKARTGYKVHGTGEYIQRGRSLLNSLRQRFALFALIQTPGCFSNEYKYSNYWNSSNY
jgi:hypothetical protein